ncbi:hypothetical protein HY468_02150 [Candidatus Roizmanbacteria bacterium]|nr:hypothetical protein [Candidatus Roizmanbacteria bacterium]
MHRELTLDKRDFSSEKTLKRIGLAVTDAITASEIKAAYDTLEDRGRESLLVLLQYCMPGKMTLQSLTDPTSPWHQLVTRHPEDGIKDIRQLFVAKSEGLPI